MEAGEIAQGDAEVLAWSLMGIGELVGMRWILWNGEHGDAGAGLRRARADHRARARGEGPRSVIGLAATATYLPERWMTAAEIGEASGIPEQVIVEKFGLRGKHIAARGRARQRHVGRGGVAAARRARARPGRDRRRPLLRLALEGLSRLAGGALDRAPARLRNAYALEYANVSCGTPVALRLARNFLLAEPELRNVLLVAACRESHLLDYANERSRFMFNFGDGAVAGLLTRDARPRAARLPRDHRRFLLAPGEGAGGRLGRARVGGERRRPPPLPRRRRPGEMKGGLDEVSLPNFVAAARGALERSGASWRTCRTSAAST